MSVNVNRGEELSAEEALKQYYDKMHALELKLKNDLEQLRLRRQGLGVVKITPQKPALKNIKINNNNNNNNNFCSVDPANIISSPKDAANFCNINNFFPVATPN